MNLEKLLQQGLTALSVDINSTQQAQLLEFLNLLQRWNQSYNLTAIKEPKQMLSHHLLDSLSISPYVDGLRIIDIGTGAGLPGLPLAIHYPDKQFTLLDSNGKKTRFLQQVVAQLRLNNVEVVQSRAESYRPGGCFDNILFRAVGAIQNLVDQSVHLCCPKGQFLLMKGLYPKDELADVTVPAEVERLSVPGVLAQRHLVRIKRSMWLEL